MQAAQKAGSSITATVLDLENALDSFAGVFVASHRLGADKVIHEHFANTCASIEKLLSQNEPDFSSSTACSDSTMSNTGFLQLLVQQGTENDALKALGVHLPKLAAPPAGIARANAASVPGMAGVGKTDRAQSKRVSGGAVGRQEGRRTKSKANGNVAAGYSDTSRSARSGPATILEDATNASGAVPRHGQQSPSTMQLAEQAQGIAKNSSASENSALTPQQGALLQGFDQRKRKGGKRNKRKNSKPVDTNILD